MKHKTWFRLVLKAIGVLFVGLSIPSLLGAAGWFVSTWRNWSLGAFGATSFSFFDLTSPQTFQMAGSIFQLLFGLYLFFAGQWLVDRCIPSNRPYCPNCGYDLSHNDGGRCSECGVTLPPREPPPPT